MIPGNVANSFLSSQLLLQEAKDKFERQSRIHRVNFFSCYSNISFFRTRYKGRNNRPPRRGATLFVFRLYVRNDNLLEGSYRKAASLKHIGSFHIVLVKGLDWISEVKTIFAPESKYRIHNNVQSIMTKANIVLCMTLLHRLI